MAPPEVVAVTFETGPGPASVLANQLVWVTEAISHELMTALSTANAGATATQWIGRGGLASLGNAVGLNSGLQTLIGWITHKIAVTQAAADAFMLARSSVIPSLVAQTNRDETAALHATNYPFGQNTPAIIERDTEYFGDYWPQNSSVGWTYAGTLAMLMANLGLPPPPAPMGASPAAPMMAGTSAAEAAARGASGGLTRAAGTAAEAPVQAASSTGGVGGELGSLLQQGPQLFSSLAEQAQSFTAMPTSMLQNFTSVPQRMTGVFSSFRGGAFGAEPLTGALAEPMPAVAGVTANAGGGVGGVGGYAPASLASYTRPSSTFTPEVGGRPTGRAGALNATELRGPITGGGMGGTPLPMSPAAAGMLGRGGAGGVRDDGVRARIVVGPQAPDQGQPDGQPR